MAAPPSRKRQGIGHDAPALDNSRDEDLNGLVSGLQTCGRDQLILQWRNHLGGTPPAHLPNWLLLRLLAYRLQAAAFGDVGAATRRKLRGLAGDATSSPSLPFAHRPPATREGIDLKAGALLAREWRGQLQRVTVLEDGFAWNGVRYGSLSQVAKAITGTSWNGHRFFGLRSGGSSKAAGTGKPKLRSRPEPRHGGQAATPHRCPEAAP
jgi:Protein of unknown function (DUF2924)